MQHQTHRRYVLRKGKARGFVYRQKYAPVERKAAHLRTSGANQHHRPVCGGLFVPHLFTHRTLRGEMVSSKNELAIANILYSFEKGGLLNYQVEPALPFHNARGRWADFRIEANGQSWYWEHCGMLSDEQYRSRWVRKKKLYEANGYMPYSDKNPDGRLIVTEDGPDQGLDSQLIEENIRRLLED